MTMPAATPALVATARRAAVDDDGIHSWTVGPEGAAEMETNPHLSALVVSGLAELHFTPAYRKADDYWRLTPLGEQWLADYDNTEGAPR